MKLLEDYRGIVPDEVIGELYVRGSRLLGKHVVHVNSTAYGGGVAELLGSLVPLMNDAGLQAGWRVLLGQHDFFEVTKKFHNALQGSELDLSEKKRELYLQTNESFSQFTHIGGHDAVIVHDLQPLPLVRYYRRRQPWVWRCHVDLTSPNEELWDYLVGFILHYDLVILSDESYRRPDLPVRQIVVHPSIDPLSLKNVDITNERCAELLGEQGIPLDKPLVTQVSRFDPWKDPEGVVEVFRRVRKNVDCRLVLVGNSAADDPESDAVLAGVRERAADLINSGDVVLALGVSDVVVNAVQRASSVVIQKSLREGFGLTVSEALWKGTPVVASAVGGIPMQLDDGVSGYLVDATDTDSFASSIALLLESPDLAGEMGAAGRERVRRDFLVTRDLGHWLALLGGLLE